MAVLKVIVVFLTLLIGVEGTLFLREYGAGETPQALQRRGGSPIPRRKASAWNGNQHANLTQPIKEELPLCFELDKALMYIN
jgi:hypothetical protein